MITKRTIAAALVLGCVSLAGCPELSPPFDTTGNYAGDFAVGFGDLEPIDGCGMLVSLDQNAAGLPFVNGQVTGTVTLSFGCVLPEDLALMASGGGGALGAGLAALGTGGFEAGVAGLLNLPAIEVTGVLLPDGTLELNTPDLLEDCAGGNCVKLALLGKGIDSDSDGRMDWFDGTFGGTLGENLGGLPARCHLAPENGCVPFELRHLLHGKRRNAYRILFTIQEDRVHVLHIRHSARDWVQPEDLELP